MKDGTKRYVLLTCSYYYYSSNMYSHITIIILAIFRVLAEIKH